MNRSSDSQEFRGSGLSTDLETRIEPRGRHPRLARPRPLADSWAEVARPLRGAPAVALFLDFDGTLTPLRERPDRARLAPATRRLLGRLARHPRIKVFIISGRSLADLRRRVRARGVRCLGVHGWEGLPGLALDGRARRSLRQAFEQLKDPLAPLDGIHLEDKHIGFALHYRGAPTAAVRRARLLLLQAVQPFRADLRALSGKKVWEVLPRAIRGKGAAVRQLLACLPPGTLPIYIGDDRTDEAAFEVLPYGITVRVGGSRRSRARFFAHNPTEIIGFLKKVEAELE